MTRKRRGRGEGSIYRRRDGRWCACLSGGYNAKGKRRRRIVYGATKQEVQAKLVKAHATGIPETTKLTVGEFLSRWLKTTVEPSLAASTAVRYEQIIRLHISPYLGGTRIDKLAPIHVEQLFAEQERQKVSVRNRELAGVVLQIAMGHAVRLKLIPFNPCHDIKKPRPPKRQMRVWDKNQVDAFFKAAEEDRLHAMYVLALTAGMRMGELFALEWSDVDFDAAVVTVNKSLEELGGKYRIKHPKTAAGRRRIDLPQFAVRSLHEHRKRMLAEGHVVGCPVFCDLEGGHLLRPNVVRRSFQAIMRRAGVPWIRFHDLRHSCATLLLRVETNPKIVAERLGHASIEVTLNTYSHVLPSMQRAAADKLDRLFG